MTPAIYLGVMLFMKFIQSVCNKKTSGMMTNRRSYLFVGALQYLAAAAFALALILFGGKGITLGGSTLAISALAALSLCVCTFCSLAAMKEGTLTLVTLFGAAGLLVPCIAGVFLFGEDLSVLQYAGIVAFLLSAWLLIGASRTMYKGFSLKTFLLLTGSLAGNGLVMLSQKLFVYKVPEGDVSSFSLLMFGSLAIVLSLALTLTHPVGDGGEGRRRGFPGRLALYSCAMAVAVFVLNQLSTLIADRVPSVVLFTVVNGGGIIITAAVAAVMFGEKITARSAAGILTGIAALVAISVV